MKRLLKILAWLFGSLLPVYVSHLNSKLLISPGGPGPIADSEGGPEPPSIASEHCWSWLPCY